MNNLVVMHAIADRMEFEFKVLTNPKNKGYDMSKHISDIKDLHEAYFELRGHKGYVSFVQGVDVEVGNVQSIYDLACDMERKMAMRYITRDREAGNEIDRFETVEEARQAIADYEAIDREDKTYTEDFYEIYDNQEEAVVE